MPNRLLTINIRNYLVNQPRRKRPMRISSWVRFRISQSTNIPQDNIKISRELNEIIMKNHLKSMHKLKVNISIEKDKAMVTPFDAKPQEKPAVDAKGKEVVGAQKAAAQPKQAAQAPSKNENAKKVQDAKEVKS